ncbi:trypco2 family protein [Pleionea sp. CnH1-48]|uniref:trypco2 family protein n=1 Tax=Pleionea sp. CnH1-48 TaxID=2954494 RepID=UPI0020983D6C|nr:trypco2 family protein [Pleionea sp. CnH1-48]MCO7226439.1 hypothetical protein [Pleionea sp. CnH1-48]
MKGGIELGEFIEQVKQELVEAQNTRDSSFFSLDNVELEVSFALSTKGKAKGKLFVVSLEGETNATQTHKVKLKLSPLATTPPIETKPLPPQKLSDAISTNSSGASALDTGALSKPLVTYFQHPKDDEDPSSIL